MTKQFSDVVKSEVKQKGQNGMQVRIMVYVMILVFGISIWGCGKSELVSATENAISDIGEVTLDSKDKIEAAEDYYNALTDNQKEQVENASKLIESRNAYDKLVEENTAADPNNNDGKTKKEQSEAVDKENESEHKEDISDVNEIDIEELKAEISEYATNLHGLSEVAVEVDSEGESSISFRVYDPNANTTSSNLGFYGYDKETGKWSDGVLGEEIDIDSAPKGHNDGSGGDASDSQTIEQYYVYVDASDGYVNLRTGPGTGYEIICTIPNGEALELYPEEATATNGKKWLNVAYWVDGDWVSGWVSASQIDY